MRKPRDGLQGRPFLNTVYAYLIKEVDTMKGVIVNCLRELVTKQFGKDKWEAALEKSNVDKEASFLATQDIDDGTVLKVIGAVCTVLNISLPQAADAFGEYWMCSYAPNIYKGYFLGVSSAKEFLLKMNEIHRITTEKMANAKPPQFEYSWENDKTLIMKYKSQRHLMEFVIGLVRGVGKHFREKLDVSRMGSDSVRIVFS